MFLPEELLMVTEATNGQGSKRPWYRDLADPPEQCSC